MAEEITDPATTDEKPPLDEAQRLAALANLTGGTAQAPAAGPAPVIKVRRSGNEVDFGGKTIVVVLARYVNETVKGQNVVARRGDTVLAAPAWVARAVACGAVAKVNG